jgi:hypothetical protein
VQRFPGGGRRVGKHAVGTGGDGQGARCQTRLQRSLAPLVATHGASALAIRAFMIDPYRWSLGFRRPLPPQFCRSSGVAGAPVFECGPPFDFSLREPSTALFSCAFSCSRFWGPAARAPLRSSGATSAESRDAALGARAVSADVARSAAGRRRGQRLDAGHRRMQARVGKKNKRALPIRRMRPTRETTRRHPRWRAHR